MSNFDTRILQRLITLEKQVARIQTSEYLKKVLADTYYLGLHAKADDSNLLDNLDSTAFVLQSNLGIWSDWTPTETGWTALPTGVYRKCRIGNLVTCTIGMTAGTSDSIYAILSLPFTASSAYVSQRGVIGWSMNNGVRVVTPAAWTIAGGGTTIEFYQNADLLAWTATGTKRLIGTFMYEAAP